MPKTKAQATQPTRATRAPKLQPLSKFERFMNNPRIARVFVSMSLLALALTTCLWAIVGARLQNNNADQLADSYLFENITTAHGARLPGQHTFLFKWPLFWLQHAFGYSPNGFVAHTVLVVLLTVGGLVYLLWRIERRPYVFGMLCLALASVLLVVPPVPYPGALLPVNMAMLTTRNLEYLLYIVGLVLLAGTARLRSFRFAVAVLCLSLLFASDRLFGTLSLGGAVLAFGLYSIMKRQELRRLAGYWLLASVLALLLASAGLSLLNLSGAVHIVGQSTANPYGIVPNLHAFLLGTYYLVAAVFTNFGVNPASSATTLASTAQVAKSELLDIGGLAYGVNLILLVLGLWSIVHVFGSSLRSIRAKTSPKVRPVRLASRLALMLIFSTFVSAASYVLTNHYYLVDSRYVTIGLFAAFISAAVYSRSKLFKPNLVLLTSGVLVLAIASGSVIVIRTSHANTQALQTQVDRNDLIAAALTGHHTDVVVGSYWRVLPLKLASKSQQKVLPLASCTAPRASLTSDAWEPDLQRHSFAYVLSLDSLDKDFADCTLDKVIASYGKPNTTTLIAGTNDKPKEVILFYDNGIHPMTKSDPKPLLHASNSIRPIAPKSLKHTTCPGHRTIMQIVAHEDDDLLFMNPDMLHSIQEGDCIRTVYITAGDAGAGKFYWLGREQGSEAAYGVLAHTSNFWLEQTVKLADHQFATVASPNNNERFSLVFMHLPDGSPPGSGFPVSNYESLAKLEAGEIPTIHSVDRQSYYSSDALSKALETLIEVYQPDELRTQLPYSANSVYTDHSDHTAAGRYATRAYRVYESNHASSALAYYIGYPIHASEANVTGEDLAIKERAFMAYSRFDGATCHSLEKCAETGVYDIYLTRQYRVDEPAPQE